MIQAGTGNLRQNSSFRFKKALQRKEEERRNQLNPVKGVTCKFGAWINLLFLSKYKAFCCIESKTIVRIWKKSMIETSLTGEESSSQSSPETGKGQRDCVDQQASVRRREAGLPVPQETVETRRRDGVEEARARRREVGPLVSHQEIVESRRRVQAQEGNSIGESESMYKS